MFLFRHRPPPAAAFSSSSAVLLKVGDVLRIPRRFTAEDVGDFARITGDANPVHFDDDVARSVARFEGRVVHGILVASLFPTVIASHFPGAIYISQTLKFKQPVYIGEEVVAEVQPINIRGDKNRYIAKFSTRCFTNGEALVLDGEAMAILPTLILKDQQEAIRSP